MILVAPDKFKGSLTAAQVASVVGSRLRASHPQHLVVEVPIADGGEGTVEIAIRSGMDPVEVGVLGPIGGTVFATYARKDAVAVIEAASAAGLGLLSTAPSRFTAGSSSTYGLGNSLGTPSITVSPRSFLVWAGAQRATVALDWRAHSAPEFRLRPVAMFHPEVLV